MRSFSWLGQRGKRLSTRMANTRVGNVWREELVQWILNI